LGTREATVFALVQWSIAAGAFDGASMLSDRARVAAWMLFNEMIAAGATKPEGYCEPDSN
jgi:hypothetical protein